MKPPDPVHLGSVQAALEIVAFFVGARFWGVAGAIVLVIAVFITSEALCQLYEIWYVLNGHGDDD
jgi:hypothetical protein